MSVPVAHKSDDALQDLRRFTLLIRESHPDAAIRFVKAAEEVMQLLAAMPGAGRRYGLRGPEIESIRFWPIKGFRKFIIFYRPASAGVEIVRVLHGARSPSHV